MSYLVVLAFVPRVRIEKVLNKLSDLCGVVLMKFIARRSKIDQINIFNFILGTGGMQN